MYKQNRTFRREDGRGGQEKSIDVTVTRNVYDTVKFVEVKEQRRT